jgi:hypothetical protein
MPSTATLATLSAILKDLYLPPVVEQLNNEVLFLQRLESRDQEIFGNQAIVPLHTNRSGRIGARLENEQLPQSGAQGYDKAVYDLTYQYGGVRVTGPAMAKTASESGSFLRVLQAELDGIRNDLRRDVARQCYSDGTGVIGATGVTTAATVVVLGATGIEALKKGQLYIGQFIDIGTLANPVGVASNREITDVNPVAGTITISGANVTTATTDRIFVQGSANASSVSKEIDGLQALVSNDGTGVVGGINPASAGKGYWKNQFDATGGALTKDILTQAFNRVNIEGGNVSLMIGSFGMQRALFNLLQAQVQYIEPLNLKGGFKALEYMQQPFVADRDAPWGKIYLLDERFIKVFSNRDWHFLDEDGHVLKWVAGFDAWEAILARYMNLGITRRNTQMVLTGFNNDPNGV